MEKRLRTTVLADPAIRGRATGKFPPEILKKHVQLLVQLKISARCGPDC